MQKETVTFDKLPEAVGYQTEQVFELKKWWQNSSHRHQENTCWLKLRMLAILSKKPNLPFIHWYAKDYYQPIRRGRNSISTRTSFFLGLRTCVERVQNRLTRRCWQICKAVSVIAQIIRETIIGVAMDTSSINPASNIDEAVDLSMRLTGTDFPVSIFPTKIQRIISKVHECHNYPTDYIPQLSLRQ